MRHVLTEIIHCKPRFHVFVLLFENSVTIQINERKLKENQHVFDKKKRQNVLLEIVQDSERGPGM